MDELIRTGQTKRTLFTLAGKSYTGNDFLRFAAAYPAGVRRQLDAFVMKTVLDYENVCLERKYPELRYQVEEYRNRLLLDKITGQESINESGQMRPVCKLILKTSFRLSVEGTAV